MKQIAGLVLWSTLLVYGNAIAQDESARDELIRTDQAWSAAASEGKEVEKVVGFWSDDAKIVPAGAQIVSGKDAIRAIVTQSLATTGLRSEEHTSELQ